MSLEEFLINIDYNIKNFRSIITNDSRLIKLLLDLQKGKNLFDSINVNEFGFVNNYYSIMELGRYLLLKKEIKNNIINNILYPIILSIMMILQTILINLMFKVNFLLICITPTIIFVGLYMIFNKINLEYKSMLKIYWTKCLLKNQIDIKSFQLNVNINVQSMRSIEELIFEVTNSSNINIDMIEDRYKNKKKSVIDSCNLYLQILSKISIISIGSQLVYIMFEFYRSYDISYFMK